MSKESLATNPVKGLSLRAIREVCDRSFYNFVRIIGGPKSGRDISPDFYPTLCEFSQDKSIHRSAIAMPRDWLKTTVFTKWEAIYDWLQNPELRQLIAAENERIGANILHWIQRTLETNYRLRTIYPDRLRLVNKEWTQKNRWSGTACDLPHRDIFSEPSISVIGVTGAAQSGHYDIIRIDDLVGKGAMESAVIMESTFRWFDNVEELLVEPDITMPDASYIKGRGTFWSNGDFFCYIMEKYPEYKWCIVPALKDTIPRYPDNVNYVQNPKSAEGDSNWPEYKSTSHYKKMMGNPEKEIIFWAQHMNNPSRSAGLNKFDPDWIKYFHYEEREDGKYIICDDDNKSFKDSEIDKYGIIDPGGFAETRMIKKGSNNAIVIGGQARDSIRKFVTWTWAGKPKDPEDFQKKVFEAYVDQKPRVFRIETFGAQDYIYRDLLLQKKKRGSPISIAPLKKDVTKGVKDDEALALIPPLANGEIYFHNTQRELIGEIINFPNGLTRDRLDCLGKLNKYYWSRTKRTDITRNLGESIGTEEGRSQITGY